MAAPRAILVIIIVVMYVIVWYWVHRVCGHNNTKQVGTAVVRTHVGIARDGPFNTQQTTMY